MQASIKLNKKKLETQVADIDKIALKKGWKFQYDKELDSLYLSPKKISSKFSLMSINDEFSVYVDKQSNIGGIFIEYYQSNLSTHDNKFKPFRNLFVENVNVTLNKKTKQEAITFSEVLKAELLSELVKSGNKRYAIPAL